MRKDFKIGLLIGLVLASAGILWVSTRPAMNSQTIMPGPATARYAETSTGSSTAMPSKDKQNSEFRTQNSELKTQDTASEQVEKIKTQRIHVVQKDETLSAIASRYYGSANMWSKIFQANRSRLTDPDKLTPGTKLLIPD